MGTNGNSSWGSPHLLGLPGQWASDNRETLNHYTTKCGGIPDWPSEGRYLLKTENFECRRCGQKMLLLFQACCPLVINDNDISERVLFIFGCKQRSCSRTSDGWRALRVQKTSSPDRIMSSESDSINPESNLNPEGFSVPEWGEDFPNESDWNQSQVTSNPASNVTENEPEDMENLSLALERVTLAAAVDYWPNRAQESHKTRRESSSNPSLSVGDFKDLPALPCFYIIAEEEDVPSSKKAPIIPEPVTDQQVAEALRSDPSPADPNEIWEGEEYEYDKAIAVDRTFLKFRKRIQRNPTQCLRYKFRGEPLWSSPEHSGADQCGSCGNPRVFECQAMPPLLFYFQEASGDSLVDEWEWTTVAVFTCSQSCLEGVEGGSWGLREEFVVVQNEI